MDYEALFLDELHKVGGTPVDVKEEKPAPTTAVMAPVTHKNLFTHPDTHPIILDMVLLKTFKMEWFGWLTDTLLVEVRRKFGNISDVNKLKLLAVRSLHANDVFWTDWEVFEKVLLSLVGVPPKWDMLNPIEAPFLVAGVDIANKVRTEEFSNEIDRYIATCLIHDGLFVAPPPLAHVQPLLAKKTYKCGDCGKVGAIDKDTFNGTCTDCSRTYDDSDNLSLNHAPSKKALAEGRGTNLIFRENEIEKAVRARLAVGIPQDDLEDPLSWQVYWYNTAKEYSAALDKDLKDQMHLVGEM